VLGASPTLPALGMLGSADPGSIATGSATVPSCKSDATGTTEEDLLRSGNADCLFSDMTVQATGNTGTVASGSVDMPAMTMSVITLMDVIARGDAALTSFYSIARIASEGKSYPVLGYNEHDDNWDWQIY